jgi:uncharacterized membrane protein YbhN (UPF0104 family)
MFMASLQDAFAIYVCFLILAIAASFGNQLPTSAFSGSIQRYMGGSSYEVLLRRFCRLCKSVVRIAPLGSPAPLGTLPKSEPFRL